MVWATEILWMKPPRHKSSVLSQWCYFQDWKDPHRWQLSQELKYFWIFSFRIIFEALLSPVVLWNGLTRSPLFNLGVIRMKNMHETRWSLDNISARPVVCSAVMNWWNWPRILFTKAYYRPGWVWVSVQTMLSAQFLFISILDNIRILSKHLMIKSTA